MSLSLAAEQPNKLLTLHTLEQIESEMSRHLYPHQMRTQQRDGLKAELYHIGLHRAELMELHYGVDTRIETEELHGQFLVRYTLGGHCALQTPQGDLVQSKDQISIFSPGQKSMLMVDRHYRSLLLRIDSALLEQHLMSFLKRPLKAPLRFSMQQPSSPKSQAIWNESLNYVGALNRYADIKEGFSPLGPDLTNWLASLILQLFPHSYSEAMKTAECPALPIHVRKARNYIEAHIGTPLRSADLATASGVSLRTLQNGFQKFLNTSLGDYIRTCRLEAVHHRLKTAPKLSVTSIFLEHGITSPGHFARAYMRRYGYPPSATKHQQS